MGTRMCKLAALSSLPMRVLSRSLLVRFFGAVLMCLIRTVPALDSNLPLARNSVG
jgi:hypothetical protein